MTTDLKTVTASKADLEEEFLTQTNTRKRLKKKEADLRDPRRTVAHIGTWYWDMKTDAAPGSDELLRIYGLDPMTQSMPAFREQEGRLYPSIAGSEWMRPFKGQCRLGSEQATNWTWKRSATGREYGSRRAVKSFGMRMARLWVLVERSRILLSEEALASERANLQAIFDVINVGMLLIDENGVVKRINNAVFQRFGEKNLLSKCSVQPGDVLGCIHAVNDPLGCGHTPHCTSCPIRNAFETVLRSGQSVNNIETEAALLIGGNEICLWLAVSADPLVLNGKKHAILAINDITERKQAMKDIESLAKFPEENPNPVMRIAANGAIVYANPSSAPLLKAWGCQVGGMLPDDYRNLILDAYRSGNRNEIEIRSGDTIYSIVLAPIVDMGYVNVYGQDVTQHRLADKALKESEQRFRDAIDNFPNVFVIYDADRRVTYVNSNGLQIMGLSEQEVIGKKDEEIFPPEMINSYLPALKLAVETKMPQTLERTRPASMGGQTIIANIIPLLDEGRGDPSNPGDNLRHHRAQAPRGTNYEADKALLSSQQGERGNRPSS